MNTHPSPWLQGVILALLSYMIWGFLPGYWKFLSHVNPFEILAYRILFSLFFTLALLSLRGEFLHLKENIQKRKTLLVFCLNGFLVAFNWVLYIWAVHESRIVESSLGYFICPLITASLGVFFLGEKINPGKISGIFLVFLGVSFFTAKLGFLPWISILLAASFSFYGLIRKIMKIDSVSGLFLETLVLTPFTLLYLLWLQFHTGLAIFQENTTTQLLLLGSGPMTAIPLILFACAAKKIHLTTLGILQYLSPTLQLVSGVILFHEPFTQNHMVTFTLIWLGLLIYSLDSILHLRKSNLCQPKKSVTAKPISI